MSDLLLQFLSNAQGQVQYASNAGVESKIDIYAYDYRGVAIICTLNEQTENRNDDATTDTDQHVLVRRK